MQKHAGRVHACLAVTCHLHFWQNDGDLLRATEVTRGWNGYQNKSQHGKLTVEEKILSLLLQGFESVTFQSRVRRSNNWAIPAPQIVSPLQSELDGWSSCFLVTLCRLWSRAACRQWWRQCWSSCSRPHGPTGPGTEPPHARSSDPRPQAAGPPLRNKDN